MQIENGPLSIYRIIYCKRVNNVCMVCISAIDIIDKYIVKGYEEKTKKK